MAYDVAFGAALALLLVRMNRQGLVNTSRALPRNSS
jgi:hypothetical protein